MNINSEKRRKWTEYLLIGLGTAVLVKLLWVGVEIFSLPSQHLRLQNIHGKQKSLSYNIHIVSNDTLKKPAPKAPSLRGYILEATYLDTEHHLAVVKINNRSLLLREGDRIHGGYVLKKVEESKVIFERDGHYYQLMIKREKTHGYLSPDLVCPTSGIPSSAQCRQKKEPRAAGFLCSISRMRYHYEIRTNVQKVLRAL